MSAEKKPYKSGLSVFRNWFSLAGLVVVAGSFFAFLFLSVIDLFKAAHNPYTGILAYLVAPGFTIIGILLIVFGLWIEHRQLSKLKAGAALPTLMLDLSRPRDRRNMVFFSFGSALFLLITAIGSYQSYHFTESTMFCGQTCHTVMEPEYVTYLHSPHARVACSECHIGPGAAWYVKAKISGAYQVYSTIFEKYHRPIQTPIKNLRPAQDTCEQCHWPQKFVGNLDVTYRNYLADETNTPYSVRMLLKVGGGDPTHGPVGGIHWHMNVANQVEYMATDEKRLEIPWVRMTDQAGNVREYRSPGFDGNPANHAIRKMDCMDCHNRPTHIFKSPSNAIDLSLALGRLDPSMPSIKKNGMETLVKPYPNKAEAMAGIAKDLNEKYPGDPRTADAIEEIQSIYEKNFFPEMKSSWQVYPSQIGHMEWPGCFRCHDGEHTTADGRHTITADCNACHLIMAQGAGAELQKLDATGQPFNHPGGDFGDLKCHDCHTGGP